MRAMNVTGKELSAAVLWRHTVIVFTVCLILVVISMCRSVQLDQSDDGYENQVGVAVCGWLDRCFPERLVQYPSGDFEGCLELVDCIGLISEGYYASPDDCARYYENVPCGDYPQWTFKVYECRLKTESPPLTEGEPCGGPGVCGFGLSCMDVTDDGEENCVCIPTPELGEQCDTPMKNCEVGSLSGLLSMMEICGNGFCSQETGKCEAQRPPGAQCTDASYCKTGYCSENTCLDYPGVGDDCISLFICDRYGRTVCIDGKCQEPLDEGALCAVNDPDKSSENLCRSGLRCVKDVCTKVVCRDGRIDDPCYSTVYCGEGLFCHSSSNTCQEKLGRGEDCEMLSDSCSDGLYCDINSIKCEPQKPNGSQCTMSIECLNGGCIDGVCGEGTM